MTTEKYTKALLAFAMAGLIAACAPQEQESASSPEPAPGNGGNGGNESADAAEADVTIEIAGDDTMSFDVTEFTVEAGQTVEIVFNNVGTMPKQSMGHNVVVLDLGVDYMEFAGAAQRHPGNEYLPPEREDEVLAATKILGPNESETITFTVPDEPGEYYYVCSFPGHAAADMFGVMTVE